MFIEYGIKAKKCSVDNCNGYRDFGALMCAKHRWRLRTYGILEGNGVERGKALSSRRHGKRKIYKKCIAPNCLLDNITNRITKGLCDNHYKKWLKYGDYKISLGRGNRYGGHSKQVGREAEEKENA